MQLEGWPLGKKKKKEGEEGGGEIFLIPSPKPFPMTPSTEDFENPTWRLRPNDYWRRALENASI